MKVNFKFQGTLFYKKLTVDAKIDIPAYQGDAGYDIHSIQDVIIAPNSSVIIKTGLALEIPYDYFGILRTRSGYGVKGELQIHHGVIDSGYRNEITIRMYNHGQKEYIVKKGDKVCQLVLFPKIVLILKETNILRPTKRNQKGIGSTGR